MTLCRQGSIKISFVIVFVFSLILVAGVPVHLSNAAPQAKPIFSSSYTALTKCGSGMTRKEEREAEKNGQDIPTRCKGYGGYDVYIYYSACASHFSLTKGDENISLGTQAVNWKQKTVEWRMADGKPFAIILRVYENEGDDLCSSSGKIKSESLMIQGLKGFEHISESVDARTRNSNLKAREIADKGFAKTGS